jgi:hypothetical protein
VHAITDEELYKAVDNVYGVLGDDAPVTEDEVIAALQRFDFDEEKAVSALLAEIGSKSTNTCTIWPQCLVGG